MNSPMNEHPDPVADALRASLAEHARLAPHGELLAEQIVHSVERPARPAGRGWRTWTLPLIAAAAVGGVVAAVAGIESYHPEAARSPAAGSHTPSRTAPVVAPVLPTSTGTGPVPTTAVVPPDTATLHGVQILDLTFAGADDGWALASADCVGGPGRCTALLRTTNGDTWTSMPGAAFNVVGVRGCADPCVTSIRFADDSVGYAYGPAALLMTTDGGRSWQRQPGGALFLETLDANVVRVTSSGTGCPGPCDVRVETAAIGSRTWTGADLGGSPDSATAGLAFARAGGGAVYLLFRGNPAGGAQHATSTLFRSSDDGRRWHSAHEPCPQAGGQEFDSSAVAAAPGGRASVLCTARQVPNRQFVATSADHGATFTARGTLPQRADQLAGDPTTVLVTAGDRLLRSSDGGRSWAPLSRPTGPVSFLGFESAMVGRAVNDGGRSIWTTVDGGRQWAQLRLG